MPSCVDLHVHSKFSDRPSQWYLRELGAAECYTEPRDVYEICRARGMQFVTISDHNTIEGALEISHLPDVFLSCEFTVTFPEDGCQVHCLVSGMTREQFHQLDPLRDDLYEFHRCVQAQGLAATVAHPLFQVNDRLTIDHLEKLLLLFDRFELINGMRSREVADVFQALVAQLTPALLEDMSRRHRIAPAGAHSWRKCFTGGSDDHSGLYVARAYTCVEQAHHVADFLRQLKRGRHRPGGQHGNSLQLGRALLLLGQQFLERRGAEFVSGQTGMLSSVLRELVSPRPTAPSSGWATLLAAAIGRWSGGPWRDPRRWPPSLRHLRRTVEQHWNEELACRQRHGGGTATEANHGDSDFFRVASHVLDDSIAQSASVAQYAARHDKWMSLILELPRLATTGVIAAAYLAAFDTQHKDDALVRDVAGRLDRSSQVPSGAGKKLWATDTWHDINGVTTTIQAVAEVARQRGRSLAVITCGAQDDKPPTVPRRNFEAVTRFRVPYYPDIELCVPPVLQLIQYIEQEAPEQLIVSTPGPVGLACLLAGKLLRIPVVGIFHTDFPTYVRHLLGEGRSADAVWNFLRWFYGGMERIFVPTRYYQQYLTENGFDPGRLELFPRGVDTRRFHPRHRRADYWQTLGLQGFQFIYVGRISPEKNVELLLRSFHQLLGRGAEANLAIVGDGPQWSDLRSRYCHPRIAFTGYLRDHQLAQAFASSDVFVFPSTTDTFGNVVLEAQASGLPLIVSDRGGPAEIVQRHQSGLIVDARSPSGLTDALQRLLDDATLREECRRRALAAAAHYRWDSIFEILWARPVGREHRDVRRMVSP